jgi:hypothetical protein
VRFVAAQLTLIGTILFWPAFFVGSFILNARGKSKHTLWMLVGATTACLGAVIRFVSQFVTIDPSVKSTDATSNAPDIYFVALIITALGYILFAFSFVQYARARPRA